jgi:P4 family phage/plasmid primase-like protien
MSAFDDAIAAPVERDTVADLRVLDSKKRGAESRAADEVAQAVLLGRFRHNPGLGWMEWDGRRWDGGEVATDRVHETVRQFVDEVERNYRAEVAEQTATGALIVDEIEQQVPKEQRTKDDGKPMKPGDVVQAFGTKEQKAAFDKAADAAQAANTQAEIWLNLLTAGHVASVAKLCRGMDGILTRAAEFDAHPDLLNCRNGVVDLRTGQLQPHDPELLITKLAGAAYDPTARSQLWDQALSAVHPDALEWFQIRMGQSITGHTPDDDAIVVSVGGGENGKTGVTIGIMRACGTYGRLISHRILIAHPGQHPTELMDLRGLRFALMEETPEEGRLNTHQLKMTIGTPQITARKMRHDDITFDTTHTLLVNTNHQPIVDATDHGTWRRLKALPWPYTFLPPGVTPTKENERVGDRTLKPRLDTDEGVAAAALAWLVNGAVKWYAAGRISPADPAPVVEATALWRRVSDVGLRFAQENLIADPDRYITADVLRAQFNATLEAQGKHTWSAQTINERFSASLLAAGIPVKGTPKKPTKILDHHRESQPDPEPPPNGVPRPSSVRHLDSPAAAEKTAAKKTARVWMGVRFLTRAEKRQRDADPDRTLHAVAGE